MRVGDVVYYPLMKTALYVEQVVVDETYNGEETTYLFRIMNKRLKEGKPTVSFTYSGSTEGFKEINMNIERPDRWWFGYLNKTNDTKRIIITGDILYRLLVENSDGEFTEFESLSKYKLARELEFFTDELLYTLFIDDDLTEMLWGEQ